MSGAAFAELTNQIESLPMFQIVMLKNKIDSIVKQNKEVELDENFIFDALVKHTERADDVDTYIREFRANDRF